MQMLDSLTAALSNLAYLFAVSRIARSFGFAQTAASFAFPAAISPSRSPSHDPWSEDTTGATFCEHLRNCDSDHEIIGQCKCTISTGSF